MYRELAVSKTFILYTFDERQLPVFLASCRAISFDEARFKMQLQLVGCVCGEPRVEFVLVIPESPRWFHRTERFTSYAWCNIRQKYASPLCLTEIPFFATE